MSVCVIGMGAGAECEQPRSVVGGVQLRNVAFVHGFGGVEVAGSGARAGALSLAAAEAGDEAGAGLYHW